MLPVHYQFVGEDFVSWTLQSKEENCSSAEKVVNALKITPNTLIE